MPVFYQPAATEPAGAASTSAAPLGTAVSAGADAVAIAALAETFRALGDPTRLRIAFALAREPRCVGDLAELASVSEAAASQHLRLLRALRIVRGHRAGKQVYYHLEDDHVRELLTVALGHYAEQPAAAV